MASFTLRRADIYPPETVLSAYPQYKFPTITEIPAGPPSITPDDTATVTDTGDATFLALADDTLFYAYAQVNGVDRWAPFSTFTDAEEINAAIDEPVFDDTLYDPYSRVTVSRPRHRPQRAFTYLGDGRIDTVSYGSGPSTVTFRAVYDDENRFVRHEPA